MSHSKQLTIFDVLKFSHEKQRALSDKLIETTGDSEERKHYFSLLKNELFAHAVAEDRYFYIPLMMTDAGLNITRHALSEHHEIDELLEQLTEKELNNPSWLGIANQLRKLVHHHLDEEEHKFFQQSGKILKDDEKLKLARKYQHEYDKYIDKEKMSLVNQ